MEELFLPLLSYVFVTLVLLLPFIIHAHKHNKYIRSTYYQITRNPYSAIRYDKGKRGEYLIYKKLRHLEITGSKFLFNLYIPKKQNETSEIDVLMICTKGLFVFESKNLDGWIFGNEAHTNWTQVLPHGWEGDSLKIKFYNPIAQNASHIRYLRLLIDKNIPIRSIIVFSDYCTLKQITIKSNDVDVIYSSNVSYLIDQIYNKTQIDFLTQEEINDIYNKLYSYTQVDSDLKEQHKNNIQGYLKNTAYEAINLPFKL